MAWGNNHCSKITCKSDGFWSSDYWEIARASILTATINSNKGRRYIYIKTTEKPYFIPIHYMEFDALNRLLIDLQSKVH
jgi:hypothetical protein